jgi:hypothetical protein
VSREPIIYSAIVADRAIPTRPIIWFSTEPFDPTSSPKRATGVFPDSLFDLDASEIAWLLATKERTAKKLSREQRRNKRHRGQAP